jgi:glycine oxidase
VIVVGAGLVGCSTAVALRRRGAEVVVLEKAVPGAEASSAAGGILSPQAECDNDGAFLRLCLAGLDATRAMVDDIERHTDVDCALDDNGTAISAVDDHERDALAARIAWQHAAGLSAQWLVPGQTALFPREARLESAAYAQGLARLAHHDGAVLQSGSSVERIEHQPGRHGDALGGVRLTDGSLLEGDAVVVCAGAWSARVKGSTISADVVFPMRGQMVELEGPVPDLVRTTFVGKSYAIPRRDGRIVIGSTLEDVGFDNRTTDEGIAAVRKRAIHALPALAQLPVKRTWSGLRPASKDGLPLLGETPVAGLFVSTGHFRNGVLLAAISGDVLARQIFGESIELDLAPFHPGRFSTSSPNALA